MTLHVRWAGQKQRSFCFWLHFSLVLSFVQAKERTSSLNQDKEKKGLKNILYWFEERRNTNYPKVRSYLL